MDRRHGRNQPETIDRLQQLAIAFEARPRRERDERRRQRQAHLGKRGNHRFEIRSCVPFLEPAKHDIVNRFHGADDKRAVGAAKDRQQRALGDEMLDLDRHVV